VKTTRNAIMRSRIGRDAILLFAAQGTLSASGFVFWAINARLYPIAVVGLAGSIVAASALVSQVSLLGMNQALLRFLPENTDRNRLINTALTLVGLTAIILGVLTFLALGHASGQAWFTYGLAITFMLNTVTGAILAISDSAMLSNHFTKRNFIGYSWGSVVRISLPFFFIPFGVSGILSANIIAQFVVLIIALHQMMRRAKFRLRIVIDLGEVRAFFRFAGTSYLAGIAWVMPLLLLPTLTYLAIGAQEGGQMYIIILLLGLLSMIPLATTQALFASASQPQAHWQRQTRRTLAITLGATALAGILVAALGTTLLGFLGSSYESGGTLLALLIPTQLLVVVNLTANVTLKLTNQLTSLLWINVTGCVATLVVWTTILPTIGSAGIAVGYATGQMIMTGWHLAQWRSIMHKPVQVTEVLGGSR